MLDHDTETREHVVVTPEQEIPPVDSSRWKWLAEAPHGCMTSHASGVDPRLPRNWPRWQPTRLRSTTRTAHPTETRVAPGT